MAQKVDEAANFVFVQLIEQEPGVCDKYHPGYAIWDKIDMAWERISHEMEYNQNL
jgi:phenylpropionate dioxygenase-like ring-hydroxylating dioxygenase large terminal subunit